MQKSPCADSPNLLCLDTRLPWTQERFEIVADAVGCVRLSGGEPSATAIAAMVRMLAGEMTSDEAIQKIIEHYT